MQFLLLSPVTVGSILTISIQCFYLKEDRNLCLYLLLCNICTRFRSTSHTLMSIHACHFISTFFLSFFLPHSLLPCPSMSPAKNCRTFTFSPHTHIASCLTIRKPRPSTMTKIFNSFRIKKKNKLEKNLKWKCNDFLLLLSLLSSFHS